ncbi:alpha/beta hydrolase family protein [Arenimonas aestuarii]
MERPSERVDGGEFARRLLSPLSGRDVTRFLAAEGRKLAAEPFAPGDFSVDLYVPRRQPEAGYGLLVFVPPMDEFAIPSDWKRVLEQRGLLLVMPRGAGNDADVFGRRIPAVLHAEAFAASTYRLDPGRRYVGGFSGGARLAQRVALAWPDVFQGSLQFAGSVLVGENLMPPPARELFDQARRQGRFVLVSGGQDMPNRRNDALARERFQALCFAGVRSFGPARLDHWVPDARGFAKALDRLEAPAQASPDIETCERDLDAAVARALDGVQARLDAGEVIAARDALVALDDRYGGLAAPRSLDLARAIEAALSARAR